MKNFVKYIFIFVLSAFFTNAALAQFASGDVFREYTWYRPGEAGSALRVGGEDDHFKDIENIALTSLNFDLTNAIKAELVIEKIQSHIGTQGLKIRINDSAWIPIPEPVHVPEPQYQYMYHVYSIIDIPLLYLYQGTSNEFRMENIPGTGVPFSQNLINGLIFRVYYDSSKVDYPTGKILTPSENDTILESVNITAEAASASGIQQVDYIGYYDGVSYEGDSIYTKWHYHYFHGEIYNHIGSASTLPYTVNWNTEWIPSQPAPIKLMARIVDNTGMIYATEVVDSLILKKPEGITVELCKPYDVPTRWVTRQSQQTEKIDVTGDTTKIDQAKLIWTSWSPCYHDGLYINIFPFNFNEGKDKCYQYYIMDIDLENPEDWFNSGVNTISNVQTDGFKHGMEIQYPGIMVLIKYNAKLLSRPVYSISSKTYNEPQKVYIETKEAGAEVRYTLDGSSPNSASTLLMDSIEIDMPLEVKARTFKAGSDSSHVASLTLDFKPAKPEVVATGFEDFKVSISMNANITGAEIRYNLDSSEDPTQSSTLYQGPIKVDYNTKIKARAYKSGWQDGEIRIFFAPITDVRLENYQSTISVFPNPVSEILNIQIKNAIYGETQAALINVLGETVKTVVFNKTKNESIVPIDMSDLKQGMYILRLTQGDNTFTKGIVK